MQKSKKKFMSVGGPVLLLATMLLTVMRGRDAAVVRPIEALRYE